MYKSSFYSGNLRYTDYTHIGTKKVTMPPRSRDQRRLLSEFESESNRFTNFSKTFETPMVKKMQAYLWQHCMKNLERIPAPYLPSYEYLLDNNIWFGGAGNTLQKPCADDLCLLENNGKPIFKLAIFGSYRRGAAIFEAFTNNPYLRQLAEVVCVITDNPAESYHPDRIWAHQEAFDEREDFPNLVRAYNLKNPDNEIPLFFGKIKSGKTKAPTKAFMELLKNVGIVDEKGNPNPNSLAIMGTFGQLISQDIIDLFPAGFFNNHPTGSPDFWPWPADVGPKSMDALIEGGNMDRACLVMHEVTQAFDDGPKVGQTRFVPVPEWATPPTLHKATSFQLGDLLSRFMFEQALMPTRVKLLDYCGFSSGKIPIQSPPIEPQPPSGRTFTKSHNSRILVPSV